ncbi:MAG: Gmad2 immunoglobulin-like domain-containing protein [Candidatus Paceibacteria bacterium]
MKHLLALFIALVVLVVFFGGFMVGRVTAPQPTELTPAPLPEEMMCTQDAMQCPDGSYVGRTGPSCEFVCPPIATNERVRLTSPLPGAVVASPLTITGEAAGWYFEGSFPVSLVNWDGLIIAEGVATAQGDWMTSDFVPFVATLTFTSPYTSGDPEFMKRGTLILQKDNPSGLPENAEAKEIVVSFAP